MWSNPAPYFVKKPFSSAELEAAAPGPDGIQLAALARTALAAALPAEKLADMAALRDQIAVLPAPTFDADPSCAPLRGSYSPLCVVRPEALGKRNPGDIAGRAALLHAIAHIEYCAIDLALDHALRFPGMPPRYYIDWIEVACEEASHFQLLADRLAELGFVYGDFPVHAGLWEMAEKTAGDVLARMAMVPRLLEARGLDATPVIQRKLAAAGDAASVAVLELILRDELGHVCLGDHWYRVLCAERGLEPEATFRGLIEHYRGPWPQSPLNREARRAAGFSDVELDDLTRLRPRR